MRLYIVAGEESGDLYGSYLVSELLRKNSDLIIRGFGGDRMEASGVNISKHINNLAFMGFTDVLLNISKINKNLKFCKHDILEFNPDAIIFIDYPGFNLKLSKFAKENGIKVFYYISPKLWAWRPSRIKSIRNSVDELIVIFPFEVDYYKNLGITAHYFGNPLYEIINKSEVSNEDLIKSDKKIIALMPGSRIQEVKRILPEMIKVTYSLSDNLFVICSTDLTHDLCCSISRDSSVKVVKNNTYSVLRSANAALVTSGTATLEVALMNIPQVVCYKTDFLTYWLAKSFIKINYISLVNIIMDRNVVNELIQSNCTSNNILKHLKIVTNKDIRGKLLSDYSLLNKEISKGGFVSEKLSEFILNNI